jgi:hypothetical protein
VQGCLKIQVSPVSQAVPVLMGLCFVVCAAVSGDRDKLYRLNVIQYFFSFFFLPDGGDGVQTRNVSNKN